MVDYKINYSALGYYRPIDQAGLIVEVYANGGSGGGTTGTTAIWRRRFKPHRINGLALRLLAISNALYWPRCSLRRLR